MHSPVERIDQALAGALARAGGAGGPPLLGRAMAHAVFPAGKRLRPRLTLAVADACGTGDPELALGAAAAIELLHCASLVHDDLPCFDAADTRRGQPSVHAAFGERLAVLAGDALIVLAFETLALGARRSPALGMKAMAIVAASVGAPHGIAAGQAWECEPATELDAYHRAKTGALFAGAAAAGAVAAGAEPAGWLAFGDTLGRAFQTADDICDVTGSPEALGKPVGRDARLGRPNVADSVGIEAAAGRVKGLMAEALAAVPDCPGREPFCRQLAREAACLQPVGSARAAA